MTSIEDRPAVEEKRLMTKAEATWIVDGVRQTSIMVSKGQRDQVDMMNDLRIYLIEALSRHVELLNTDREFLEMPDSVR